MLSKVKSFALSGIDGYLVDVETDMSQGLSGIEIVGLPGATVKESKERLRSSIKNSGLLYPSKRITINLAPADTKKEGPSFDLALAVGILSASGQIATNKYKDYVFLGELSLDGNIRAICGVMPLLISATQQGYKKIVVPYDNQDEASYIKDADVYAVKSLKQLVDFLNESITLEPICHKDYNNQQNIKEYDVDFADIKGQFVAKRAIQIAVSGGHNILMMGPPGAGKTMIARAIPTIMPDMSFDEAIEVTKIHSIAGILDSKDGIVTKRPFRTPHHTTTIPALIGGGPKAQPGEVSLAHNGVLFLDEMPEYSRHTLESLRQPIEDKVVTIARVQRTVDYPANFMLVASMNPCPCGNYGSKTAECHCTPREIRNYMNKISGPLLDRIDLQIEVDNISYEEFSDRTSQETSKDVKERVNKAREIQRERFKGTKVNCNAQMTNNMIKKYCVLDSDCEKLIEKAFKKMNLSARATTRVLKVARTIADIDGKDNILPTHIAEAIQYRSFDRKLND